jgi:RNA polymerase sigma-70 factor (ECF subfamily)
MVRLVQALDQYDARSRFSTWTYRVTTNVCISQMRSAKVRRTSSLDVMAEGPEGSIRVNQPAGREPDPHLGVERADVVRRLAGALAELEPDQRAILILRDGQDLSYEHIADVLGVGLGTVKSRLFRARSALRAALEEPVVGRAEKPIR